MTARLQKYLADCGIASRRASEQIILEGRVEVNGKVVNTLGAKVDPLHDHVNVDGRPVRSKRKLYLAMHKPRGMVCSKKDEFQRPRIYDLLPREWEHLQSVGRLDYNSEGLIFLTNDGEFSLHLTHPRYGIRKVYLATVAGRVTEEMVRSFVRGVNHEGEKLQVQKGRILSAGSSVSVVELELAEGKYREVRRLFESQGLLVKKLQRTQIGKIKLGTLRAGKWRTLTESEIKSLLG